jgi:hypothetical protein
MKKFRAIEDDPFGVWPRRPVEASKEEKPVGRERRASPDEMVRQLQGVFCKGRYRSWSASVAKP